MVTTSITALITTSTNNNEHRKGFVCLFVVVVFSFCFPSFFLLQSYVLCADSQCARVEPVTYIWEGVIDDEVTIRK